MGLFARLTWQRRAADSLLAVLHIVLVVSIVLLCSAFAIAMGLQSVCGVLSWRWLLGRCPGWIKFLIDSLLVIVRLFLSPFRRLYDVILLGLLDQLLTPGWVYRMLNSILLSSGEPHFRC